MREVLTFTIYVIWLNPEQACPEAADEQDGPGNAPERDEMEYEGKGGVGYRQKQAILDAGHDGRASSHGGGPHDGVVLAGIADPASYKS